MNYSPEQFFRLVKAIEDDGGELLDKMCVSKEYPLTGPKGKMNVDGTEKRFVLPGCGNTTIFEIPYESPDNGVQPIELCAVCDDLGGTPRFAAVMGDPDA